MTNSRCARWGSCFGMPLDPKWGSQVPFLKWLGWSRVSQGTGGTGRCADVLIHFQRHRSPHSHVKTRTSRRCLRTAVPLTHAGSFTEVERWLPKSRFGAPVGLPRRTDRHGVLQPHTMGKRYSRSGRSGLVQTPRGRLASPHPTPASSPCPDA